MKLQPYLYSFSIYTVKPLVKTVTCRISTHARSEIIPLSTILKKKEERKQKGKRNEDLGSAFLNQEPLINNSLKAPG